MENGQAPHFFFSLLEKKKRAAWRCKEKEGLVAEGAEPYSDPALLRPEQRYSRFDTRRTPLCPTNRCRLCGAWEKMLRSFPQHHGAAAEREKQCIQLAPNWEMFCLESCSETTARSVASLIQGPFFLLHPGALFFFRPSKKEEGADSFLIAEQSKFGVCCNRNKPSRFPQKS